jgi:hypothetical protein
MASLQAVAAATTLSRSARPLNNHIKVILAEGVDQAFALINAAKRRTKRFLRKSK